MTWICTLNEQKIIPLNSKDHATETPKTIDELITVLSEGERTTYNHTIHSIKFPANTFDKYSSWSDECYTRNCIINNEQFELILLFKYRCIEKKPENKTQYLGSVLKKYVVSLSFYVTKIDLKSTERHS